MSEALRNLEYIPVSKDNLEDVISFLGYKPKEMKSHIAGRNDLVGIEIKSQHESLKLSEVRFKEGAYLVKGKFGFYKVTGDDVRRLLAESRMN